jgi:D-beta-D-heptose 7-phosphate kinase/D-beta-D-heptose 1-phosphate adenosyltransferase
MWLDHGGKDGYLPASAREVADVTGAGDTVIATLALAIAAGGNMFEAARLANEAASIVVGKFGAATVTPQELKERF